MCVHVCACARGVHALEKEVSMRERGVHERVGHVCVYCENVHSVCVSEKKKEREREH